MTSIRENAQRVLSYLAAQRNRMVKGAEIAERLGLEPDAVNDAVGVLIDGGLATQETSFGTQPFDFSVVQITSRGRLEADEA